MKAFHILIFLLAINIQSAFAQDDDAVIKVNKEQYLIELKYTNNVFCYQKLTTIQRTIKVNSLHGLQEFGTLYIPTFDDLNFKIEIVNLKAGTQKTNGTFVEVKKEKLKETTLPANVPFLYGYKGKVKQLAFESLEIGDEIFYEYTVKYTSTQSHPNVYHTEKNLLSDKYPVLANEVSYSFSSNFKVNMLTSNTQEEFINTKNTYSLKLNNLPGQIDEPLANKYEHAPYYVIQYTTIKGKIHTNWPKLFGAEISSVKTKEFFMGGKTINELSKVAKEKTTDYQKIEAIKKEIWTAYKGNYFALASTLEDFSLGMEEVGQLFKLFSNARIQANVLLLRNKNQGPYNEEFISLGQFHDLMVEFMDGKGKKHYWMPYAPHYAIDEFPAQFHGTKALQIQKNGGSILTSSVLLPKADAEKNTLNKTIHIELSRKEDQLEVKVKELCMLEGGFTSFLYPLSLIAAQDTTKTIFWKHIKAKIEKDQGGKVDTVLLKPSVKIGQVIYEVQYSYLINSSNNGKIAKVKLNDLLEELVKNNANQDRKTTAYFDFPCTKAYNLTISFPGAKNFIENDFINSKGENEVASFISQGSVKGNTLNLSITFKQNKDVVNPGEWNLYQKVALEIKALYAQSLGVVL